MYLIESRGRYALPAPPGHYVTVPALCEPLVGTVATEACDHHHAGLHISKLSDAIDDAIFPPLCSPGSVGASLDPAEQSTPRCSEPCPPGMYCGAGSAMPRDGAALVPVQGASETARPRACEARAATRAAVQRVSALNSALLCRCFTSILPVLCSALPAFRTKSAAALSRF